MAKKLPQDKIDRIFDLLADEAYSFAAIASMVSCSEVTVRHYAAGRRRRKTGPSEETRTFARQMWKDGVPLEQICHKARLSLWKLKDICSDLPQRTPKERLTDAQTAKLREMYVDNVKVAVIAATFGCTEQTVRQKTRHLPRRIRRSTVEVNMQRCVIVSTLDEEAPYLVQPTGRMEFCSSAVAPERQWQIEALDTRDGRLKMIAMADITAWKQPLHGAPAIVGIKTQKTGSIVKR